MTDLPRVITAPNLENDTAIRHGFFTRTGGVSAGIYGSLNVGFGSDDESANVTENRRRAMAGLGLDADALHTVYQVHGTDVVTVSEHAPSATRVESDGLVTKTPGVALGILTADCVPVLFADHEHRVIGAAHAGWKGAVSGILDSTVASMVALGAAKSSIAAAIGPAIAQQSYEVGPEFFERFSAEDKTNERYFLPSQRAGHWMFDLKGYVRDRLARLDIQNITDVNLDTYAEDTSFFSYRRATHMGEPDYGRCLSSIGIDPGPI